MSKRIYWAAPIHKQADADLNAAMIAVIRSWGYEVWSPQEAGIASVEAQQTGEPLEVVRKRYMKKDLSAMKTCDVCIAYLGHQREPSQGMLWEMGYMTACNKLVIIFNPVMVKYTLMAEFTADWVVTQLEDLRRVLDDC